MQRRHIVAGFVASVAAATSGCYSQWDVARQEIRRLDGYQAPATVVMRDNRGNDLEFDEDTQIIVPVDGRPAAARIESARVSGDTFEANTTRFGVVRFSLEPSYSTVRLRRFSPLRLTIISTAATAGAVVLVILIIAATTSSSTSRGWGYAGAY